MSPTGSATNDAAYLRRVRFVLKWRRIALMVCLLLCIDAAVTVWLDPGLAEKSHVVLLQSLFVFMVALVIAMNVMTFRLRK